MRYARERIPTLFALCWVIVAVHDLFLTSTTTNNNNNRSVVLSPPPPPDGSAVNRPTRRREQQEPQQEQPQQRKEQPKPQQNKKTKKKDDDNNNNNNNNNNSEAVVKDSGFERDGFMVLGMHRSGTSLLTGLLYQAVGYKFGGHLHKGGENPRGFFERFDVVGQNSAWMNEQGIDWPTNVEDFSWERAVRDKESGAVPFKGGARASKFFNNPSNAPWLQKDPRMCITLNVWRNLGKEVLAKEPAIVFTYRHPLEVAKSVHKRAGNRIRMHAAFRLWIVYNTRAVQNSRGMCTVRTNNISVLADPMRELTRISEELTDRCGLPRPKLRKTISRTEIDKFLDRDLQHHDASANKNTNTTSAGGADAVAVLETHNGGACPVYEYLPPDAPRNTPEFRLERRRYLAAMRVYCDLESGKAYREDYVWPDPKDPGGGGGGGGTAAGATG